MTELNETTEPQRIWQDRVIEKANTPALTPLEDRSLLAHLMLYHPGKVHEQTLAKAEIYMHPAMVQTFHMRYHDLRIAENVNGTEHGDRRNQLMDDTRTLSVASVAYAVNNTHDYNIEPFAYVFDAIKLKKRGYELQSYIEGDELSAFEQNLSNAKTIALVDQEPAAHPVPDNKIIGRINLPTQWAGGKADDKLTDADRAKNSENSEAVFIHRGDMFLVDETLVPAEQWLRLREQERAEHIASQQGIV